MACWRPVRRTSRLDSRWVHWNRGRCSVRPTRPMLAGMRRPASPSSTLGSCCRRWRAGTKSVWRAAPFAAVSGCVIYCRGGAAAAATAQDRAEYRRAAPVSHAHDRSAIGDSLLVLTALLAEVDQVAAHGASHVL